MRATGSGFRVTAINNPQAPTPPAVTVKLAQESHGDWWSDIHSPPPPHHLIHMLVTQQPLGPKQREREI